MDPGTCGGFGKIKRFKFHSNFLNLNYTYFSQLSYVIFHKLWAIYFLKHIFGEIFSRPNRLPCLVFNSKIFLNHHFLKMRSIKLGLGYLLLLRTFLKYLNNETLELDGNRVRHGSPDKSGGQATLNIKLIRIPRSMKVEFNMSKHV